ncbi:MAG: terpene cyclase/mutase family protein, partial [Planctomycetota bacterium]|nr:terpene cyclase/mutase family protein [Planctomycetota bacterium]
MSRMPLLLLVLALAGIALLLLAEDDTPAVDLREPPRTDPAEPPRDQPGLAVHGTAPAPLKATASASTLAEQARIKRLETLWDRALALHRAGRSRRAWALLEPLLASNKAFFEEPERARELAALRQGAREVLDAETADERLRELVAELRRWGNLRPDEEAGAFEQKLRHAAGVIAKVKDKRERERLERHLRRFLVPRGVRRPDGRDDELWRRGARVETDLLLDRVQQREEDREEPTVPLPIDDPEEVEKRRMEQLELLRQRGALTLLETLHRGLAFLALHQAPDGRFSAEVAATRFSEAHPNEPDLVGQVQRGLSKRDDRYVLSATALALMAFLDFRDQDGRGLFEPTIARAVAWLRAQQQEDGLFRGAGRRYYSDAITLMALAQAAGASGDEELKKAVARGLEALYAVRGPQGGYRYRAEQPGDLSVAGWVAQALEYAALAEIPIPKGMREELTKFLDTVWMGRERFAYLAPSQRTALMPRASLYPVGMLMGRILWDLSKMPERDARTWSEWLTRGVGRRAPALYTLYYGVRMDVWMHTKLTTKWHDWLVELARRQIAAGPLA